MWRSNSRDCPERFLFLINKSVRKPLLEELPPGRTAGPAQAAAPRLRQEDTWLEDRHLAAPRSRALHGEETSPFLSGRRRLRLSTPVHGAVRG